MVTSICSVTSPPRLRGSKISRRAETLLHSLMRGDSAIWMASRKVSHSPHRVVRSSGSTRASRAEISSCWSQRLHNCAPVDRPELIPQLCPPGLDPNLRRTFSAANALPGIVKSLIWIKYTECACGLTGLSLAHLPALLEAKFDRTPVKVMRLDELPKSARIEDRRSVTVARGGIGIGTVVVLGLIGWALGIDPRLLIGGAEMMSRSGGPQQQADAGSTTSSGSPSDTMGQFVSAVLGSTEAVWTDYFAQAGQTYKPPT